MNKRSVVLVFNRYYLPGYKAGGPIRTLVNLTDRLGEEFYFRIGTLNRDVGESLPYSTVTSYQWTDQGMAKVYYCSPEKASGRLIAGLVKEANPDVIYLNSFFDPIFTQRVLWARRFGRIPPLPMVLAPRGELSAGALGLKSVKKRLYLMVAKLVGLYRGVIWQASSDREKADIQRVFPEVSATDIRVARNLAPVISNQNVIQSRKSGQPLQVCFLSRISPMKNLDYALQVLTEVESEVHFTIYGPKELPSYWDKCQKLINEMPEHITVTWQGELSPFQVHDELSKHDLFFLPTRGENYGHVIHEALSAGLPVLISDQTPWNDIEARGVGWAYPLGDMDRFSRRIDEVASWSQEQFEEVKRQAQAYGRERSEDSVALEANRRLFLDAIAHHS